MADPSEITNNLLAVLNNSNLPEDQKTTLSNIVQSLKTHLENQDAVLANHARRLDALDSRVDPVVDRRWWLPLLIVSANYCGLMTLYILRVALPGSSTPVAVIEHPATAAAAILVTLGQTVAIFRLIATGQVSYRQYRHLARASLLLFASSYGGLYFGPTFAAISISLVFYLFFMVDTFNEYRARDRRERDTNNRANNGRNA